MESAGVLDKIISVDDNNVHAKLTNDDDICINIIPRMKRIAIIELIHRFDECAKKVGLQYWLIAGSLLGAIRHNGPIPWDDDLDIIVRNINIDMTKKLIEIFSKKYSTTYKCFSYRWGKISGWKIRHISLLFDLDIFIARKTVINKVVHYYTDLLSFPEDCWSINELYKNNTICTYNFGGKLLPSIVSPEQYLHKKYPGWDTTVNIYNHSNYTTIRPRFKYTESFMRDLNLALEITGI
jgi:hypothetical protein